MNKHITKADAFKAARAAYKAGKDKHGYYSGECEHGFTFHVLAGGLVEGRDPIEQIAAEIITADSLLEMH